MGVWGELKFAVRGGGQPSLGSLALTLLDEMALDERAPRSALEIGLEVPRKGLGLESRWLASQVSTETLLRKGATGTGLQVGLKVGGLLSARECKVGDERPQPMFCGVR